MLSARDTTNEVLFKHTFDDRDPKNPVEIFVLKEKSVFFSGFNFSEQTIKPLSLDMKQYLKGKKQRVTFLRCKISLEFIQFVKDVHRLGSEMFHSRVEQLNIDGCTAVDDGVLNCLPFGWGRLTVSTDVHNPSSFPLPIFINFKKKAAGDGFTRFSVQGYNLSCEKVGTFLNEFVRHSSGLKTIRFQNCNVTGKFFGAMFNAITLGNSKGKLTEFSIAGSQLDQQAWDDVASIVGHSHGTLPSVLHLDSCNISNEILGRLSITLALNKNLTELSLGGLDLVSSDTWDLLFVELEKSEALNKLTTISFYNCDGIIEACKPCSINDRVIKRLAGAKALHTIRLGCCPNITQTGWEDFAQEISKKQRMKEIEIGNQNFNNAASTKLADCIIKTGMQVDSVLFMVVGKDWGWEGVYYLLKGNANIPHMSFLCCSENQLAIKSLLEASKGNDHLKRLGFSGSPIITRPEFLEPFFEKKNFQAFVKINPYP
ncbi:hypothetical protein ACHAWX_005662 [Stephanocyclus meneghinianus]